MKIKIGSTRIDFLTKTKVIKVPIFFIWRRFISGIVSNYREKTLWDLNKKSNSSKYISKVYYNLGGFILIAERASLVDEPEFNSIPKNIKKKMLNFLLDESELVWKNVGKTIIDNEVNYILIDTGVNINPAVIPKYFDKLRKIRTKIGLE